MSDRQKKCSRSTHHDVDGFGGGSERRDLFRREHGEELGRPGALVVLPALDLLLVLEHGAREGVVAGEVDAPVAVDEILVRHVAHAQVVVGRLDLRVEQDWMNQCGTWRLLARMMKQFQFWQYHHH